MQIGLICIQIWVLIGADWQIRLDSTRILFTERISVKKAHTGESKKWRWDVERHLSTKTVRTEKHSFSLCWLFLQQRFLKQKHTEKTFGQEGPDPHKQKLVPVSADKIDTLPKRVQDLENQSFGSLWTGTLWVSHKDQHHAKWTKLTTQISSFVCWNLRLWSVWIELSTNLSSQLCTFPRILPGGPDQQGSCW